MTLSNPEGHFAVRNISNVRNSENIARITYGRLCLYTRIGKRWSLHGL